MDRNEIANRLDQKREAIVERVVAAMLRTPFWAQRYGPGIQERLLMDINMNTEILAKAIRYRSPMIFDDHMRWRRDFVMERGASTGRIRETLSHKWQAISELLPAEALPMIMPYMQSAIEAISYHNSPAQQLTAAHELLAEDLTSATFDTQWHWQLAYESTGRAQARTDNWYLIDFLIDSVGHLRPDPVVRYVVLMSRQSLGNGLSSTHHQQQLWLLAQAVERRISAEYAGEPCRILMAAATALVPENEACRALEASQDAIIGDVISQLIARGLNASPDQTAVDIGWMLAYLRDSMAQNDPRQFVAYTQLMQHSAGSQSQTFLHQSCQVLDHSLATFLPQYAAQSARTILRAVAV